MYFYIFVLQNLGDEKIYEHDFGGRVLSCIYVFRTISSKSFPFRAEGGKQPKMFFRGQVHVMAEHIDEFVLLHITGEPDEWTLRAVKLRHPAEEAPAYF